MANTEYQVYSIAAHVLWWQVLSFINYLKILQSLYMFVDGGYEGNIKDGGGGGKTVKCPFQITQMVLLS